MIYMYRVHLFGYIIEKWAEKGNNKAISPFTFVFIRICFRDQPVPVATILVCACAGVRRKTNICHIQECLFYIFHYKLDLRLTECVI